MTSCCRVSNCLTDSIMTCITIAVVSVPQPELLAILITSCAHQNIYLICVPGPSCSPGITTYTAEMGH